MIICKNPLNLFVSATVSIFPVEKSNRCNARFIALHGRQEFPPVYSFALHTTVSDAYNDERSNTWFPLKYPTPTTASPNIPNNAMRGMFIFLLYIIIRLLDNRLIHARAWANGSLLRCIIDCN